jgi:hypothetical protein
MENHEVRTAWGFLAVRLPPEDKQWAAVRATILEALGVLDPDGKPTALVETVKAADLARLTQQDWQRERDKMLKTCNQCHLGNFAKEQLQQGDNMIRNACQSGLCDVVRLERDAARPYGNSRTGRRNEAKSHNGNGQVRGIVVLAVNLCF